MGSMILIFNTTLKVESEYASLGKMDISTLHVSIR